MKATEAEALNELTPLLYFSMCVRTGHLETCSVLADSSAGTVCPERYFLWLQAWLGEIKWSPWGQGHLGCSSGHWSLWLCPSGRGCHFLLACLGHFGAWWALFNNRRNRQTGWTRCVSGGTRSSGGWVGVKGWCGQGVLLDELTYTTFKVSHISVKLEKQINLFWKIKRNEVKDYSS